MDKIRGMFAPQQERTAAVPPPTAKELVLRLEEAYRARKPYECLIDMMDAVCMPLRGTAYDFTDAFDADGGFARLLTDCFSPCDRFNGSLCDEWRAKVLVPFTRRYSFHGNGHG